MILLPAALATLWGLHSLGVLSGGLRPYRRYIAAAVILAAFVPYIVWEILNPPRVDATARGRKIDYEFADPEYAGLFAAENGASEVW